jgi:hypothetical protein
MKRLWIALGFWISISSPASAQLAAVGGPTTGFDHIFLDLFASRPPFFGLTTFHILDAASNEVATVNCNVAELDRNIRLEMTSFYPGSNTPSDAAESIKNMRTITILRPSLDRMYVIFPTLKSYVETRLSQVGSPGAPVPGISKTVLGKETISDMACVKSQWVISDPGGAQRPLVVWTAPDLGDFPWQAQFSLGANQAIMTFSNLHLDRPDDALFELPTGFIKFEGVPSLIVQNATNSTNGNVTVPK